MSTLSITETGLILQLLCIKSVGHVHSLSMTNYISYFTQIKDTTYVSRTLVLPWSCWHKWWHDQTPPAESVSCLMTTSLTTTSSMTSCRHHHAAAVKGRLTCDHVTADWTTTDQTRNSKYTRCVQQASRYKLLRIVYVIWHYATVDVYEPLRAEWSTDIP